MCFRWLWETHRKVTGHEPPFQLPTADDLKDGNEVVAAAASA